MLNQYILHASKCLHAGRLEGLVSAARSHASQYISSEERASEMQQGERERGRKGERQRDSEIERDRERRPRGTRKRRARQRLQAVPRASSADP